MTDNLIVPQDIEQEQENNRRLEEASKAAAGLQSQPAPQSAPETQPEQPAEPTPVPQPEPQEPEQSAEPEQPAEPSYEPPAVEEVDPQQDAMSVWRMQTLKDNLWRLSGALEREGGPGASERAMLTIWDESRANEEGYRGNSISVANIMRTIDKPRYYDTNDAGAQHVLNLVETAVYTEAGRRGLLLPYDSGLPEDATAEQLERFRARLDAANAPRWEQGLGLVRNAKEREEKQAFRQYREQQQKEAGMMLDFLERDVAGRGLAFNLGFWKTDDLFFERDEDALDDSEKGVMGASINRLRNVVQSGRIVDLTDTRGQQAWDNVYNAIKERYEKAEGDRNIFTVFNDAVAKGWIQQGLSWLSGDTDEKAGVLRTAQEIASYRNPRRVESAGDIDGFGAFCVYMLESFGEMIPQIAEQAVEMWVGGKLVGAAMKGIAGGQKALDAMTLAQRMKLYKAGEWGMRGVSGISTMRMNLADVSQQARDEAAARGMSVDEVSGIERWLLAVGYSAVDIALDPTLGMMMRAFNPMRRGLAKGVIDTMKNQVFSDKGVLHTAANVLMAAGKSGAMEALGEGPLQGGISRIYTALKFDTVGMASSGELNPDGTTDIWKVLSNMGDEALAASSSAIFPALVERTRTAYRQSKEHKSFADFAKSRAVEKFVHGLTEAERADVIENMGALDRRLLYEAVLDSAKMFNTRTQMSVADESTRKILEKELEDRAQHMTDIYNYGAKPLKDYIDGLRSTFLQRDFDSIPADAPDTHMSRAEFNRARAEAVNAAAVARQKENRDLPIIYGEPSVEGKQNHRIRYTESREGGHLKITVRDEVDGRMPQDVKNTFVVGEDGTIQEVFQKAFDFGRQLARYHDALVQDDAPRMQFAREILDKVGKRGQQVYFVSTKEELMSLGFGKDAVDDGGRSLYGANSALSTSWAAFTDPAGRIIVRREAAQNAGELMAALLHESFHADLARTVRSMSGNTAILRELGITPEMVAGVPEETVRQLVRGALVGVRLGKPISEATREELEKFDSDVRSAEEQLAYRAEEVTGLSQQGLPISVVSHPFRAIKYARAKKGAPELNRLLKSYLAGLIGNEPTDGMVADFVGAVQQNARDGDNDVISVRDGGPEVLTQRTAQRVYELLGGTSIPAAAPNPTPAPAPAAAPDEAARRHEAAVDQEAERARTAQAEVRADEDEANTVVEPAPYDDEVPPAIPLTQEEQAKQRQLNEENAATRIDKMVSDFEKRLDEKYPFAFVPKYKSFVDRLEAAVKSHDPAAVQERIEQFENYLVQQATKRTQFQQRLDRRRAERTKAREAFHARMVAAENAARAAIEAHIDAEEEAQRIADDKMEDATNPDVASEDMRSIQAREDADTARTLREERVARVRERGAKRDRSFQAAKAAESAQQEDRRARHSEADNAIAASRADEAEGGEGKAAARQRVSDIKSADAAEYKRKPLGRNEAEIDDATAVPAAVRSVVRKARVDVDANTAQLNALEEGKKADSVSGTGRANRRQKFWSAPDGDKAAGRTLTAVENIAYDFGRAIAAYNEGRDRSRAAAKIRNSVGNDIADRILRGETLTEEDGKAILAKWTEDAKGRPSVRRTATRQQMAPAERAARDEAENNRRNARRAERRAAGESLARKKMTAEEIVAKNETQSETDRDILAAVARGDLAPMQILQDAVNRSKALAKNESSGGVRKEDAKIEAKTLANVARSPEAMSVVIDMLKRVVAELHPQRSFRADNPHVLLEKYLQAWKNATGSSYDSQESRVARSAWDHFDQINDLPLGSGTVERMTNGETADPSRVRAVRQITTREGQTVELRPEDEDEARANNIINNTENVDENVIAAQNSNNLEPTPTEEELESRNAIVDEPDAVDTTGIDSADESAGEGTAEPSGRINQADLARQAQRTRDNWSRPETLKAIVSDKGTDERIREIVALGMRNVLPHPNPEVRIACVEAGNSNTVGKIYLRDNNPDVVDAAYAKLKEHGLVNEESEELLFDPFADAPMFASGENAAVAMLDAGKPELWNGLQRAKALLRRKRRDWGDLSHDEKIEIKKASGGWELVDGSWLNDGDPVRFREDNPFVEDMLALSKRLFDAKQEVAKYAFGRLRSSGALTTAEAIVQANRYAVGAVCRACGLAHPDVVDFTTIEDRYDSLHERADEIIGRKAGDIRQDYMDFLADGGGAQSLDAVIQGAEFEAAVAAKPDLADASFVFEPIANNELDVLGGHNVANSSLILTLSGLMQGPGAVMDTLVHEFGHEMQAIEGWAPGGTGEEDTLNRLSITGDEAYRRLAGEVMSRALEARRQLSREERLGSLLQDTMDLDVPAEDRLNLLEMRVDGDGSFRLQASKPMFASATSAAMAEASDTSIERPLMAVHGMTLSALGKALDSGSFVMPSIATRRHGDTWDVAGYASLQTIKPGSSIVDDRQNVFVLFDKGTITGANDEIYRYDAFTPTINALNSIPDGIFADKIKALHDMWTDRNRPETIDIETARNALYVGRNAFQDIQHRFFEALTEDKERAFNGAIKHPWAGPFTRFWNDVVFGRKTVDELENSFREENLGAKRMSSDMKSAFAALRDLENYNRLTKAKMGDAATDMAEAKPWRYVPFSEAAVVLIDNTAPAEIEKRLKDAGVGNVVRIDMTNHGEVEAAQREYAPMFASATSASTAYYFFKNWLGLDPAKFGIHPNADGTVDYEMTIDVFRRRCQLYFGDATFDVRGKRMTFNEMWETAQTIIADRPETIDKLFAEILEDAKNGRSHVVDGSMKAVVFMNNTACEERFRTAFEAMAEASEKNLPQEEVVRRSRELAAAKLALEESAMIMEATGRGAGQALAAHKMMARSDYTYGGLMSRALSEIRKDRKLKLANKQGNLTESEKKQLCDMAAKLAKTEQALRKANERIKELEGKRIAENAIGAAVKEGRQRRASKAKIETIGEAVAFAKTEFALRQQPAFGGAPVNLASWDQVHETLQDLVRRIGKAICADFALKNPMKKVPFETFENALFAACDPIFGKLTAFDGSRGALTAREYVNLFSDYEQYGKSVPQRDPVQDAIRRMVELSKRVEDLERIKRDGMGFERYGYAKLTSVKDVDEELAKVRRDLAEADRASGVSNFVRQDPNGKATALDRLKKSMMAEIQALQDAIDKGVPLPDSLKEIVSDAQSEQLKERLADMRALYKKTFGESYEKMTDDERLAFVMEQLEKRFAADNRKLANLKKYGTTSMFRIGKDGGIHYIEDTKEIRDKKAEIRKVEREIRELRAQMDPETNKVLLAQRMLQVQKDRKQHYEDKAALYQEWDKTGKGPRGKVDLRAFLGDAEWRKAWNDANKARREADQLLGKLVYDRQNILGKTLMHIGAVRDILRSYMASGDESGIGIQAAWYMLQHPVEAVRAAFAGAYAMFNKEFWENKSREFLNSPRAYLILEAMGVKLPLNDFGYGGAQSEEVFARNWVAEHKFKIFGFNLGKNRWLDASERGFSYPIMVFRINMANRYLDFLEKVYGGIKSIPPEDLKYAGRVINAVTGAGDFFGHGEIKAAASHILWAPGRPSGQLQTLLLPLTIYAHNEVSKRLKNKLFMEHFVGAAAKLGALFIMLALANKLFGGDDEDEDDKFIEWDPTSSKFGRIKIGNRYVSVTGNLESYIRPFARMVRGTTTGRDGVKRKYESGPNSGFRSDVMRMLQGKLRPDLGMWLTLFSGKDLVGHEIDRSPKHLFWENGLLEFFAKDNFAPLTIKEVWEAARTNGIKDTALLGTLAWIGVSGSDFGETPFSRAKARVQRLDQALKDEEVPEDQKRAIRSDGFNARLLGMKPLLNRLDRQASDLDKKMKAAETTAERDRFKGELEAVQKRYVEAVYWKPTK